MRRDDILMALKEPATRLDERGIGADIYIIGGAAIALAYNPERESKDVVAVFTPKEEVRKAAAEVARRLDLPENWLNDAAIGFLPQTPDPTARDIFEAPGLRVMVASAEHLPAMKLLAARSHEDADDIRFLCGSLGIRTASEAQAVALKMYPEARFTVRTRLVLEEILGPEPFETEPSIGSSDPPSAPGDPPIQL